MHHRKRYLFCIAIVCLLTLLLILWLSRHSQVYFQAKPAFQTVPSNFGQCTDPNTVFILSMEGGAMRGIIPAYVLNYLETQTGRPIAKLFNVIGGTSTGAIAALVLTAANDQGQPAYTTDDLIKFYNLQGAYIFTITPWQFIKTGGGLFGPKFDSTRKQQVMQTLLGDKEIINTLVPVVLTGYQVNNNQSSIFSTWKAKQSPDNNFYVANVLNAITSPPVFFPPVNVTSVNQHTNFLIADGAIGLQDPSMLILLESMQNFSHAHHFVIVSLGTGKFKIIQQHSNIASWGLLQWLLYLFPMFTVSESQETNFDLQMLQKLNEMRQQTDKAANFSVKYFRIDLDVPQDLATHQFTADTTYIKSFNDYGKLDVQQNQAALQEIIQLMRNSSYCSPSVIPAKAGIQAT